MSKLNFFFNFDTNLRFILSVSGAIRIIFFLNFLRIKFIDLFFCNDMILNFAIYFFGMRISN